MSKVWAEETVYREREEAGGSMRYWKQSPGMAGRAGRRALRWGLPSVWCLDVSGLELPLYLSRKQLLKPQER